jgi:acetyltransferase
VAASSLDPFFQPRAVAVVGASRDPRKLGYIILDNLLRSRFDGPVYAVNPGAEAVLGAPAFASIAQIGAPVDLAVIVVPATAVADVIDDAGRAGVRAAVIITAGFREVNEEGAERERRIVQHARAASMRLIGPNSVGIVNTFANLNATFAESAPLSYEVALLSQSGAVATAIIDWARAIGAGFSKFVSLGNMADVNEVELVRYLADDTETKLIVLYLEGFSDARAFLDAARLVTRSKPIVAMKVGSSAAGARAASSHTGSLASPDAIVDAAFRQAGITRAYTMDELFDYTLAFSYLPMPRGPNVAIVTNAGGPAVMAADAVERYGLRLARLSDHTASRLASGLPAAASVRNPIDLLGDARSERYRTALEIVLEDPNVDALVALLTPQAVTEPEQTARSIAHAARMHGKPVMAVYMGGEAVARGRVMLDMARVPAYFYPERAIRALAAMCSYARYVSVDA